MPSGNQSIELRDLLPANLGDWHTREDDRVFNKENLYSYIDGGAELYLSYGFAGGIHREYFNKADVMVSVDIFDMTEAKNAFGVFGHSRETDEMDYGQGSQDYGDAIIFWKDKYYMSISSRGQDDQLYETIKDLAGYIDNAVKSTGQFPPVIQMLPGDNLLKASILYFNHYAWQNFYTFIDHENILNIGPDVDAVLAKYITDSGHMIAALIEYPSTGQAQVALKSLSSTLKLKVGKPVKKKNNKWMLAGVRNQFIVLIPDASDKKEGSRLLTNIIDNIK